MRRELWIPLAAGLFLFGVAIPNEVCREALKKWGIAIPAWACPDGTPRQTAEMSVSGVRRGAKGRISFAATAHYTTDEADDVLDTPIKKADVVVTLVDRKNNAKPLDIDWKQSGDGMDAELVLPEVEDGDYKLHATYTTKIGAGELDVPLPLYTPARIHVITDRPLYEPGNTVKFRAVVLRARDLSPLDHRPGLWTIKDPQGEVLLEEKGEAGEWGVVSGSFPLDKDAPTGAWRVAWVSADAMDEIPFTVEPFTLPRFRVEAATDKPFFQAGDTPTIKGKVLYSSGAPVANAKIDIEWNIGGDWPPPTEWQAKLLPKNAVTNASGGFDLALPRVPDDLQGKASLTARISAVDPAGDRVEGSASVLLSHDGITASAVTELGNGLVSSFNNRLFVRVATADGRVVTKKTIKVKRTWQPEAPVEQAELDEDGVASLQIDPGAPVNIVIPAQPYRPVPKPPLVRRGEATELIGDEGASLADQVEMDRWLAALAPCAKWYSEGSSVEVGLRVAAGGNVMSVAAGTNAADTCVANVVRGKRLPAGTERLYRVTFNFNDPELPTLTPAIEGVLAAPEGLAAAVNERAAAARDCLPNVEGDLPEFVTWQVRAKSKQVTFGGWARDPKAENKAVAAMSCVQSRFGGSIAIAEEAEADAIGVVHFSVSLPETVQQSRPQPTTMIGYELDVSAEIDGKPVSTKLRIEPGVVPNLRMRVTPVIAKPGDTLTAELIRGPQYRQKLPKEIEIECLKWKKDKLVLDEEHKTQVTIDPSVEGWCEVTGGGVRSLVYVKPAADLAVTIAPKQPTYKPGQRAELIIQTLLGGKGGKAAVGLLGVDESLGQLVPLPGPDSMGRIRPQVTTSNPAFGTLDGQALALGRIRGANAQAATVLRVSEIPKPPQLDAVIDARGTTKFDPVEELTDHFYIVLAELHTQARKWEATAPATEKMHPATMAKLWTAALDACKARGEPITDAYGRRLRLSLLPSDLQALTDPRNVIVVGTRLPEDVEDWSQFIGEEKP